MVVKVQTNELETLLECCCLMKMTFQTGRTVWEAQLTEVLEDHDRQEILMDQQAQPDTDVPGVWRCQIEPKIRLVW